MKKIILGIVILIGANVAAQAAIIDFDDNVLEPDSYFDPLSDTVWSSGGVDFDHGWNFECCWSGFTYSNKTDTTTAGFGNDRSAITGDGVGSGQDNYAIGFTGNGGAQLDFGSASTVLGGYFTNATYAYLAMAFGDDGNTPAFVKGPFGEDDWFKVIVTGLDAGGNSLGSLDFLLADGASVIDAWTWFDLSGLGEVYGLSFSLDSSDQGDFGMNTPAYFAMDSMSVVPVPAAVWLFVSGLAMLGFRSRIKA
jgi:hypothetical protein